MTCLTCRRCRSNCLEMAFMFGRRFFQRRRGFGKWLAGWIGCVALLFYSGILTFSELRGSDTSSPAFIERKLHFVTARTRSGNILPVEQVEGGDKDTAAQHKGAALVENVTDGYVGHRTLAPVLLIPDERSKILTEDKQTECLNSLQSMNLQQLLNRSIYNISYPTFYYTEPYFAWSDDVTIFRNMGDNNKTVGEVEREKLRGVVAVINNSSYNPRDDCGWMSDLKVFKKVYPVLGRVKHLEYMCPLVVPGAGSFQHFVDGVLPKIMQAYDVIVREKVHIILNRPNHAIITEMLTALGLNSDRVVYAEAESYYAERQINTCITPPLHPGLYARARGILGVPEKQRSLNSTVVLMTRSVTTHGRRIRNQNEVTAFLSQRYHDRLKVITGSMSLTEVKMVMEEAGLIIGVHGGALYNMLFAPGGCSVVEILPVGRKGHTNPYYLADKILWQLAQNMGHRFWRTHVMTSYPLGDLVLPVSRLSKVLDMVDLSIKTW